MDVPSDWTCPACGDSRDDVTYMTPCLHRLCYGCALRWAMKNPWCPFCRETIKTIKYSVRSDDDYLECAVPEPAEHLAEDQQEEQEAVEPVPRAPDLSFPPEVWAAFFREHPENVEPLLAWLQQELETISGSEWWEVAAGLSTVIGYLCVYGLDEEGLVRALQPCLKNQTLPFVVRLITAAVELCSTQIRRQRDRQDAHAVGSQEDSPAAAHSHATSPGGTRAPATTEEEEAPEEPGQAAAGPSAQGRDCLPGGRRRAPKRRASSSLQDSPQPRKRPPRRRH